MLSPQRRGLFKSHAVVSEKPQSECCCLKPTRGKGSISTEWHALPSKYLKSASIHATSPNTEKIYWVPGTQNCNKNILLYFFKIKSQTVVIAPASQNRFSETNPHNAKMVKVIINTNYTNQCISAFTSKLESQQNQLNPTEDDISLWSGKLALLGR